MLDLRPWDFERDGPVQLKGQWEFYWKQLLSPQEISVHAPAFAEVPQPWNRQSIPGAQTEADGMATYRLRILLPENSPPLAMRFEYQGSSFRAYWNGAEILNGGSPGPRETEKAGWLPRYSEPIAAAESGELIVHVSNHVHRFGGLWLPITLGTTKQISSSRDTARAIDMFLAGSLLIMGIYHLGIFFYRRKETAALWFGLFCLLITLRALVTGEKLLMQALPGLPFGFTPALDYLSFYASVPIGALFMSALFPAQFHRRAIQVILYGGGAGVAAVLALPLHWYSYTLYVYQAFTLCMIVYAGAGFVRAAIARESGAQIITFGAVVFSAASVSDMAHVAYLVGPGYVVPLGFFVFTCTLAVALAQRIATAFSTSEELAENLQAAYTEAVSLRQALVEKETMAAVGSMAAGIVHDLKNPVAIIKGYAEMADEDAVTREERSEYIKEIENTADRMIDLVQDLLEYSRGAVLISKQSTDLDAYARQMRESIAPIFEPRGIKHTVDYTAKGPIYIDPMRFLRAVMNIAGNAADAMKTGGSFSIRIFESPPHIVFELTDTGPGIPESVRDSLFEPFVTHGKAHGTGLGMAVTKSMVEAHGGTISFTTESGKGTTFRITIPAG